jgi:uncharacterized damage-inducible protein DinB
MEALIETWIINQKMNVFLLNGINEAHLADVGAAKGRTVGEQFAHIHNVRLMWLKAAAPELLTEQVKFEKDKSVTLSALTREFIKSADAIAQLLQSGLATGRIKGFKPHPQAFLGYIISHESHHRGQIILTLKENNHMPDKKTLYGLWEWGTT